jgi:hypothetical protein
MMVVHSIHDSSARKAPSLRNPLRSCVYYATIRPQLVEGSSHSRGRIRHIWLDCEIAKPARVPSVYREEQNCLLTSKATFSARQPQDQPTVKRLTFPGYKPLSIGAGSLNTAPSPLGSALGGMTKLTVMELRASDLTGSIPSTEIGLLTDMQMFRLSFNAISGTIPTELGLLTRLSDIQFTHEDFVRPIPTEIGILTKMENLSAYSNNLTGTIPSEMGHVFAQLYKSQSEQPDGGSSKRNRLYGCISEHSYRGPSCKEEACQEDTSRGGTRNLIAGVPR